MDKDERSDIEQRIAELKRRWPAHSAPPGMWQELEELEDALRIIKEAGNERSDGRETGSGGLQ